MTPTSSLAWVRSGRCESANCVEAAITGEGTVAIRNSEYPAGPIVTFSLDEWKAFVGGVRDGEFEF